MQRILHVRTSRLGLPAIVARALAGAVLRLVLVVEADLAVVLEARPEGVGVEVGAVEVGAVEVGGAGEEVAEAAVVVVD